MKEINAALFDVDGVLINAPELFSRIYASKYGLDVEKFNEFFRTEFTKALVGQVDLKNLITQNRDIWKFGTPDQILAWWFEAENHPNMRLVDFIKEKRSQGLKTFMTSDQEKYRAEYIYEVIFPDLFDGKFVSSELGYRKEEPEYWKAVITELGRLGIAMSKIIYFDDGQNNVDAATASGIRAVLYTGPEQVEEILR